MSILSLGLPHHDIVLSDKLKYVMGKVVFLLKTGKYCSINMSTATAVWGKQHVEVRMSNVNCQYRAGQL